jgi:hypothetical protein
MQSKMLTCEASWPEACDEWLENQPRRGGCWLVAALGHEDSFWRGYYSPSTNLDLSEWVVMYRQFIESGLIVKSEPASD